MFFGQTLMSRFAIRNIPATRRSRRAGTRPAAIEALEVRKYLSATMTVMNDGHTLTIVGDSGNNKIDIVQDDRGVHVTADRGPNQNFTGIDSIVVQTGYGNDDVRVIYGFNPQPDPPGNQLRPLDLRVSLGSGDDKFVADVQAGTRSVLLGVDAGTGNDVVTFKSVIDPNVRPAELIDPNDRSTMLYANLGDGNDTFNGDLQFPPDPCRLVVMGGGGADSINALIGLLSNATPAGDANGSIDVSLNGGDGNDNIQSAARNVNLNGRVTIDLQGGAGSDIVQQSLETVRVNAGLDLIASGGTGDDSLVLSGIAASRTAAAFTPTLIANSRVSFNFRGDLGNDRLTGLIQPCVTPAGTLDLIFEGGAGNDLFNLMLDLEPGELNPPSNSDPASVQDGPVQLAVLGGDGDDRLYLFVPNLGKSESLFAARLDGGAGLDTAVVSRGLDLNSWTE